MPVEAGDVDRVAALAAEIWYEHYPAIITLAQIAYMLGERYAAGRLYDELARPGIWWDKLLIDGGLRGFSSYFLAQRPATMKLDKLYVHASCRRRGLGGMLIARAIDEARRQGCSRLELAVNKHNTLAIQAYRKHGFEVADAVVKDIGGGFVMDDYVMEIQVTGG